MSFFVAFLMVSANAAADPAAAVAVQDSAAATAPAVPEKKKKQKLICKTDDADSGSHMARRTCRTAEEWDSNQVSDSHSGFSIRGEMMQGH